MTVTLVTLSSGTIVDVLMPLSEMRRLLDQALQERRTLVTTASDGKRLVLNPYQVQSLKEE